MYHCAYKENLGLRSYRPIPILAATLTSKCEMGSAQKT